ncbi:hypothetical protein CPS_4331 [Colwellia psychrerythraea 34H]|uniref:Uncharacterized protein n=1 Tax=Colwellia psychrerythraea (strain 34H / ATCC BAA-681) TaxID=167879 RepID=Q47W41_COLP3|nr:hypothetical protein CPS_4331 [Colwellia psychrerythraea 34H]
MNSICQFNKMKEIDALSYKGIGSVSLKKLTLQKCGN